MLERTFGWPKKHGLQSPCGDNHMLKNHHHSDIQKYQSINTTCVKLIKRGVCKKIICIVRVTKSILGAQQLRNKTSPGDFQRQNKQNISNKT